MESLPGLVVPAYRPGETLVSLVEALLRDGYPAVVVVDDGSGPAFRPMFEALARLPRVAVVRHFVNLGKGDALKSGLNHLFVHHPELAGAVTVDADGQHLPGDVKKVAEALVQHPDRLCLGVRGFEGAVPWKSRLGNDLTRFVLMLVSGQRLRDTQTGLRGIPRDFATELLRVRAARYEFELEMILLAREQERPLLQVPIETVYEDANRGSHFNPVWDSLRIYFVFFRFLLSSLATAVLDFAAFSASYGLGASLLGSVAMGRVFGGAFNFVVNQRLVFKVGRRPLFEATRYVGLVLGLLVVSYALTLALVDRFGWNVYLAKLAAEGSLFLVSFATQRVFVFAGGDGLRDLDSPWQGGPPPRTDWDAYYRRPAPTARFTRKLTERALLRRLALHRGDGALHVLELGGGNSCFYPAIRETLHPQRYTVVDDNPTGLALFERRYGADPGVAWVQADVTALPDDLPAADVCFSVGLIEHFDEAGTAAAIDAHFDRVRPGGLVVLFFPTPTWLYRAARAVLEAAGLWTFPDERPLPMAEVLRRVQTRGRVRSAGIHWKIVLTQGMVAAEADGRFDPSGQRQ